MSSNKAAVLHAGKDLRIEQRPVPQPGPEEAVVAVKATGLCGSDLHYYRHGRNGDFIVQRPMALGHEAGGIITAIGSNVKNVKVGQRVAFEAGIYCKSCRFCKVGKYNLCENMRFCSSAKTFPHLDGTLQDYMAHPADLLHPLPDSVTFEQAALIEPLSVVIHASRRAKIQPGYTVLVFGAGAVGLLACSVAKVSGASRIAVVDIDTRRLSFAKANGFATDTYTISTKEKPSLEQSKTNATTILKALDQPLGFSAVFECTGVESCAQAAIHCAETSGRVILIGMGTPNMTLPVSAAAFREVDIIGSFRYCNTYPAALRMMGAGAFSNIEKLVTHKFPLQQSLDAFETLATGKDAKGQVVIKVMIGDY